MSVISITVTEHERVRLNKDGYAPDGTYYGHEPGTHIYKLWGTKVKHVYAMCGLDHRYYAYGTITDDFCRVVRAKTLKDACQLVGAVRAKRVRQAASAV